MMKGVPIQSFSRAISALKAINRNGSMTMMEISRAADVPYPTAHRIVKTLLYEGLIEQEPARKRYRPTLLVKSLSSGYQDDEVLVDVARPHIVELTRKFGWPVSIAIRVGKNMMLRDSTHANTSLTFSQYYPGFTLPLLDSASGKLSMAFAEVDMREQILKWMRADQDIDPEYLAAAELSLNDEGIRSRGYAVQGRNYYNHTPGKTSSIAVPVFRNGIFEAAMTLVFFATAHRLEDALEIYLATMLETAKLIGEGLDSYGTTASGMP
jgi:IclR family mhp operon transcriptional activator